MGKRTGHVSINGAEYARLRRFAKSRAVSITSVVESLLSDLPPTEQEAELLRLARDPEFGKGKRP